MPITIAGGEAARGSRGQLLHILGASFGVAIAVGGMIGVGILRAPSVVVAQVPVAWMVLGLWALGGVHAMLEANVVSELGTALPRAGGPYIYAHRAFGDVGGLFVGWTTWIERLAATAALSVAFADFLALIWPADARFAVLTAVAMQLAVFGLNMIGLRQGRTFQQVTSSTKALALLAFCCVAVAVAPTLPRDPPVNAGPAPVVGLTGLIAAYQLIVGAYSGWYEPAFFAEEDIRPGRSLPLAMGLGLLLTATLYIGVNASLVYALGAHGMAANALPFTTVLAQSGGPTPAVLFAVGAMVSVVSCANAGIMSAPRALFALSRDGLLPEVFQNVNEGGSPYVAFLSTAAGSIALAITGSFGLLFGLIGMLEVASLVVIITSIFVLRRREPELSRPFRAVGYPFLPAFVLVIDVTLLVLFLGANRVVGLYAAVMWLLCVPFAMIARRARRFPAAPTPGMNGDRSSTPTCER